MSLHTFPSSVGNYEDRIEAIVGLCGDHLRHVTSVADDGLNLQLEFNPDLTSEEELKLQRMLSSPSLSLLSLNEWAALTDERMLLRAYTGASSPTAAQTAAALKALIKIVRLIVRD